MASQVGRQALNTGADLYHATDMLQTPPLGDHSGDDRDRPTSTVKETYFKSGGAISPVMFRCIMIILASIALAPEKGLSLCCSSFPIEREG